MSNQWYQDLEDDDDEGQGQQNTGQAPKALRAALAKAQKEAKELKEQNEKLLKQVRENTISQVLTTKGVPKKLAKLIPADIEPTAEAVEKWLEEYSDLFPVKPAEGDDGKPEGSDGSGSGSGGDGDGGDEAAQMARIAQAANGAQAPGKAADLIKQITAKDLKPEDLLALIHSHGGGAGAG